MRATLAFLAAAALSAFVAKAQAQNEVIPHAQDRPPGPALSPEEAIAKMTVPEGFTVELVASEPDLVNPVAMTIDERGRFWVTESLEYPRREPGPGRDRIKVIEDTDGDGKADRFTIFAEGLNIPSGIAVGHGGVWVGNSPDILFYPNADGDLKPDGPPEVVATGFGRDDTHELPNSFTWGPDGRLYGWNGVFNPSKVTNRKGETFSFTCAIWRIDPRTRDFDLFCEGTSNPWGIAINPEGSFFASACVIDHLWHLAETGYYIRQGGPYPPFTWPIGSIVDHKHQKAAYCGIHYFDSSAYPEPFRDRLYMGNIHGNCINVDALTRNGATYQAEDAPDFLNANDAWFMPVVQKTGPDGCLYILDWYDRYHCYQDANRDPAGIDRLKGRLYRVRYKDTPRRAGFNLAKSTDDDLIELLSSPNVYDRDTAQRLLTERGHDETRPKLQTFVLDESANRKGRMHALFALCGSGRLEPVFHARLLDHGDATLRAWGVHMAGNMGEVEPSLRDRVVKLADDESPDVRLQVAIASRKVEGIDAMPLLVEVLSNSDHDPLIPQVVWQNLHPLLPAEGGETFAKRIEGARPDQAESLKPILPRALERILQSESVAPSAVSGLLAHLLSGPAADPVDAREALETLTEAVRSHRLDGSRLDAVRTAVQKRMREIQGAEPDGLLRQDGPLGLEIALLGAAWGNPSGVEAARAAFASAEEADDRRIRAFEGLIAARPDAALQAATELFDRPRGASIDFRSKILETLGRVDEPGVADVLLARIANFEPPLRGRAIDVLTQRPVWAKALIEAVESKKLASDTVTLNQLRRLSAIDDPAIADRIKAIWGTVREGRNPQRDLVIGQMRNFLHKTPGDPYAGQQVFAKLCAQCHKIYGEGQDVGPDLTGVGRNDFEQLLSNVFDPSLVIGPAYQAVTVATNDGRVLTGLLAEDSPEQVVLKVEGGKQETIARDDVEDQKVAEVSLMPEDVEKQLLPQEIADLFAFLCLDKPPSDPSARLLPGAPEIKIRPASER